MTTKPFDIAAAIEVAETTEVTINHPASGEPVLGDGGKPISITVYGPASKEFKAAQNAQSRKNIDRFKRKGKAAKTEDEEAADAAALLSAITVSFNNFTYKGGEQGRETFRACYLDPKMGWLTDQVNNQAGDWSNFTKG